ncbi:MAG: CBS domain-containing protein [Pseudomonadota bacterium]
MQTVHAHYLQVPLTLAGAGEAVRPLAAGDAAAESAMTDFRRQPPPTIRTNTTVATARRRMAETGVDTVLVADRRGQVVGVLTAADCDAAPPSATAARAMTPLAGRRALDYADVCRATLEDMVIAFKTERTHCLPVDETDGAARRLRGLIDVRALERLLGAPVAFVPRRHGRPD